jgi:hypothetical protein
MRTFSFISMACLTLGWLLAGCSPEHNWREVGFEGTNLKVQLPCKPDRTTRAVPMGTAMVDMQVAGCESGSAMVAVMTTALLPGADADALLAGWQQATLNNARVATPLPASQMQPWRRPGFLPLTAAQRVQAQGQRADGQPVAVDAVWGAVADGERVRLVHAVVYDRQREPDMVSNLLDGIRP